MNHDPLRPRVTLEDLLRVKRAERPPAEFWDRFDRELRAKQLAAIVNRRPWWRVVPRAVVSAARLHLPLGATAVLALSIFTLRDQSGNAGRGFDEPILPVTPLASATVPLDAEEVSARATEVAAASVTERDEYVATAVEAAPTVSVQPGEVARAISMMGGPVETPVVEPELTPSARSIASNLDAVPMLDEPDLMQILNAVRGFELQTVSGATVEPLAQVRTPQEAKRARYLATALPTSYAMGASERHSVDRVSTRIDERRLYEEDAVSRFGAQGDRLLFKF